MGEHCLSEWVYQKIKDKIFTLEFRPGQILQERALAEMFHTSRNPVQRALLKLENEGWILINSRKNLVVRDVTARDVIEIYQARKLLEETALEEIFRKDLNWDISFRLEETLLKMRQHWDSYLDYIKLDEEFHGIIVSALDNGRIDKFYSTIREEFIRLGMMAREKGNFRQKILDSHMGIILPIRERNREEAQKQLHCHLDQVEERLLRYIEAIRSEQEALASSQ